MKQIKTILVCGLVLALTGLTTMLVAAGGQRHTKAIVRSVHGKVEFKAEDGQWKPLRVNQELTEGTLMKSDVGADAYLQVNGLTSTVKLQESTTISLAKMLATGAGMSADTSTDLKLDVGEVLGSVRKLSANSDYQVTVPNGVAGIRGTDFAVKVVQTSPGVFLVTFTSVTGQIQASATVTVQGVNTTVGQVVVKNLTTGQSWTPGPTCEAAIGVAAINFPEQFQPPPITQPITPIPITKPIYPPSETGGNGGTPPPS
jgi:hypothetical protein